MNYARQRYASNTIINGIRLSDHLGLVGIVVKRYERYAGGKLGLDDLWQAGVLGLVTGLRRFDATRGTKISTYVLHWIRHFIARCVQDCSRTVRIPVHRWRSDVELPARESSLDASLEQVVSEEPDPEDSAMANERGERARAAFGTLSERERHVLERRVVAGEKLEEIGREFPAGPGQRRAVSRERVRQVEALAKDAFAAALAEIDRRQRNPSPAPSRANTNG